MKQILRIVLGGSAVFGEGLSILPIDATLPAHEAGGNVINDDNLSVEWLNDRELLVTGDPTAGDKPLPVISGVTIRFKKTN